MNLLKEEIADLGKTLDRAVANGSSELQQKLDASIELASREVATNVDRIGSRLDQSIARAETGLKASIAEASQELQKNIRVVSEELHSHRVLTKDEIKGLIDYACMKMDATIENRVAEIRTQTSALIDEKVSGLRRSLTEAALEQKRAFVRNAYIAVGSATFVAAVSIASKKLTASPFDALAVYRIVLGVLVVGTATSLAFRLIKKFQERSEAERDLVKVVIHDIGMINPRGVGVHLVLLFVCIVLWLMLLLQPESLGLGV
jgi:hypothetical protein